MTIKQLTVRLPRPLYSELCTDAGKQGVTISDHIRRIIEREHSTDQVNRLRLELLDRLDRLPEQATATTSHSDELILLCRAIAAHLNPQLVAQVKAKLSQL